jgi:hypothetical protein
MGKFIDLTGQRFGRLKVKEFSHKNKWGSPYWICLCDCGNTRVIRGSSLRNEHTQSCGCINTRNIIHGQSGSLTYTSREGMITRCYT